VGDLARFYQSDEDFHRHIALFAGCGPVIEEIARVKVHMDRFRQLTVASVEDLAMVIAQHRPYATALPAAMAWQPKPACSCICGGSSLFWSRPKPVSALLFRATTMKIAIWGRQRDHVGESPFWDAVHGCLWSVDMTAQAIRRRWPDGRTDSFPLPNCLPHWR
jgi:hypothetical protein